jgi:hypothetical protein
LKNTTASEIAVTVAGDSPGNIKSNTGTKTDPPPAPTSVP